jgi:hypothetical protein
MLSQIPDPDIFHPGYQILFSGSNNNKKEEGKII